MSLKCHPFDIIYYSNFVFVWSRDILCEQRGEGGAKVNFWSHFLLLIQNSLMAQRISITFIISFHSLHFSTFYIHFTNKTCYWNPQISLKYSNVFHIEEKQREPSLRRKQTLHIWKIKKKKKKFLNSRKFENSLKNKLFSSYPSHVDDGACSFHLCYSYKRPLLNINISNEIFIFKWANDNLSKYEFKSFVLPNVINILQNLLWSNQKNFNILSTDSINRHEVWKPGVNCLQKWVTHNNYFSSFVSKIFAYHFKSVACTNNVSVTSKKCQTLSAWHENQCHLLHFNGIRIPMTSINLFIKWLKLIDQHITKLAKECTISEWPKNGHQNIG